MAGTSVSQLYNIWQNSKDENPKPGVPEELRKILNGAFADIPASNFPMSHLGKIVEISSEATIAEAVQILAENRIFSAPVKDVSKANAKWVDKYIGMVDFAAILVWVLEQAELAASLMVAGTATASGVTAGALAALSAAALQLPSSLASISAVSTVAVGATIAAGMVAEKSLVGDDKGCKGAEAMGGDFFKILLHNEPFCSVKVSSIAKSYRWAPFLAIQPDDNMLTVLLLLSKFRMRSIPVVERGKNDVVNLVTQSAVVRGLANCGGLDWFDVVAKKSLKELGLPLMDPDEVVSASVDTLVLEAFLKMKEKGIGGMPVIDGKSGKVFANISVRDVEYLLLHPELFANRKSLTAGAFVEIVSKSKDQDDGSKAMFPPLTCTQSQTLSHVIDSLAKEHMHRIHVIDSDGCVIGVVTLRDIISCFVSEPEGYFSNFLGGAATD